jgi:hypothetical protein
MMSEGARLVYFRNAPLKACSLGWDWIKTRSICFSVQRHEPVISERVAVMIPISVAVAKLAKLLGDDARLDEKIRDTKSALSLIQKRVSELLAQHYIATKEPRVQIPEDLMKEEEAFERLLQALQDMKSEITKQIRPVEEQIIEANRDHLRQSFTQESRKLNKCLEELDDNILACRQYLQEYDRIRGGLQGLNEKLAQLGAESLLVPDGLPTHDLGEIVRSRIEHLKSQGKI